MSVQKTVQTIEREVVLAKLDPPQPGNYLLIYLWQHFIKIMSTNLTLNISAS